MIEMKTKRKYRLFIDMDGTLTVFDTEATMEQLRAPGYFAALSPLPNMTKTVERLLESGEFDEVYILSSYLDGTNAIEEKDSWLDHQIPQIDTAHRIYPICGTNKSSYIPGGVCCTDLLLDDYSVNLHDWQAAGGLGVKLLNGINGRFGTWKGAAVSNSKTPEEIAGEIIAIKQCVSA